MSESADRSRATEASRWFTVMTGGDISPRDLDAFRAWRRDPANAAAFAKVKAGWEGAGALAERPAIVAATEAALEKYAAVASGTRPSRRFRLTRLTLAMASLVVIGAVTFFAWRQMDGELVTKVGGQRLEVLADGSHMRMNTDTRVRVAYRGDERRIELEHGQAFFDVAHDASRPFVVEANGAQVRAIGTRFDVRYDTGKVKVTLLQGRVEIRAADGSRVTLSPGQAAVADRSGVSRPEATNPGAVTSWTTGRITFSGVPLRDAVAEVNRYSKRKVVLDGAHPVTGELVSGQFVAGDVDSFVAGARSLYGLKVVSDSASEIRLAPG